MPQHHQHLLSRRRYTNQLRKLPAWIDWMEFIILSARYQLYEMPMLWAWDTLFVAPSLCLLLEAQNRKWIVDEIRNTCNAKSRNPHLVRSRQKPHTQELKRGGQDITPFPFPRMWKVRARILRGDTTAARCPNKRPKDWRKCNHSNFTNFWHNYWSTDLCQPCRRQASSVRYVGGHCRPHDLGVTYNCSSSTLTGW